MTNRSWKRCAWLGLAGLVTVLVGCGGKQNLGSDRTNAGAETDAGSAGAEADDVGGGGGSGGSGGPFVPGGGAGMAGSAGKAGLSPRPGVACDCDEKGDSTCHGSLASLCASIPGCNPALAEVRDGFAENVCSQDPFFATYLDDTEHVIVEYGFGADNTYRMIFESASGELVGAALSGYVGYACNLAGKTDFVEGVQVADDEATCRLCANEESVGGAGGQPSDCPW